ncbi:MAG: serine/threonine protein kinase [Isosphaeraceae bacterium]|nr:serine/threonine protein kinase [Isosphaeraceae bacterium]
MNDDARGSDDPWLPLSLVDLVDRLCDQFEADWSAGRAPRIEDVLAEAPLPAAPALLRELVLLELALARGRGERLSPEWYRARFPDHAGIVDEAFLEAGEVEAASSATAGDWKDNPTIGEGIRISASVLPSIAGYELLGELGRGGMGVVYKAYEHRLNRLVALKMLSAGSHASPEQLARFRAEAETVGRLRHGNIVRIHAVGDHEGLPFFEMEYVEGGSLASRLDGTPWRARDAAELVAALARGVEQVHQVGVVHRDLKPGNVLIDTDGTPKLVDFGLAKDLTDDSGLTRTDAVLGSPSYMAPEQAEGGAKRTGPPADVYALGAIFYELLTGRPPFRGATVLETLQQVKTAEPVPPSRLSSGVPRDAETIALKCLEKAPGRRYPTAGALAEDLHLFLEHRPIVARRTGPLGRLVRWARRRPGVASLVAAVVLLLLTITAVSVTAAVREAAAAARERRFFYFARMNLVQQAWDMADVRRMRQLLGLYERDDSKDLRGFEWYYWQRLTNRSTADLRGHTGTIDALAFAPDGTTLASGGRDGRVFLWPRKRPGKAVEVVVDPSVGEINALAFSPDGAIAALGGEGGVIQLADLEGRPKGTLRGEGQDSTPRVMALVFRDARTLVSAHEPNVVRVWDLSASRLVREIAGSRPTRGRTDDDHQLPHAFSADARWLATAGRDGRVVVRETGARRRLALALALARPDRAPDEIVFQADPTSVRSLGLSADGATLAVGGEDRTISIWEVARLRESPHPQPRHVLRGHRAAVWSFAFSPGGSTLAAASLDNTVSIWDVATGRLESTLKGHWGPLQAVAFSPDGSTLASAGDDKSIKLWGALRDETDAPLVGPAGGVDTIALAPDGRTLAAGDRTGGVTFWEMATHQRLGSIPPRSPANPDGHPSRITALLYTPDGRTLITGGWGSPIRLWDARAGKPTPLGTLPAHSLGSPAVDASEGEKPAIATSCLALSPDGNLLAAGATDGTATLWDLSARSQLAVERFTGWNVNALAFSPDGQILAAAQGDGPIELYEPQGHRRLGRLDATASPARSLVFSPDGRTLATGGADGELTLWDVATRRRRMSQSAHTNQIVSLAFTPNGKTLASGGRDDRIRLWDAATCELKTTLAGHTGNVMSLTFSADGQSLASGSLDGTARLWRAATDTLARRVERVVPR